MLKPGESLWCPAGSILVGVGVDTRSQAEWKNIKKIKNKQNWPHPPYLSFVSRVVIDNEKIRKLPREIRADVSAWLTTALPRMPSKNFQGVSQNFNSWKQTLDRD